MPSQEENPPGWKLVGAVFTERWGYMPVGVFGGPAPRWKPNEAEAREAEAEVWKNGNVLVRQPLVVIDGVTYEGKIEQLTWLKRQRTGEFTHRFESQDELIAWNALQSKRAGY